MAALSQRMLSFLGGGLGLASGLLLTIAAALWTPTFSARLSARVERDRAPLEAQLQRLARIAQQVDAAPIGEHNDKTLVVTGPAPDFRQRYGEPPDTWNAGVVKAVDLARLQPGKRPGDVLPREELDWAGPSHVFGRYYEEPFLINAADMLYAEPGLHATSFLADNQDLDRMLQLRYLVVVRLVSQTEPEVAGEEFTPGGLVAEGLLFDLETGELIGGFPFIATNSDAVPYEIEEASSTEETEAAARAMLMADLYGNLEAAFWHTLHEALPAAVSDQSAERLPAGDV
ncbi:hypothetical protein [Lignipirellula cremea]|uniref:Uncharacterized protein n=1 Tax=Lignipirellula cremea TaxID=2528010 RepID=A0A518DMI2_9BACT|nr:hypothetical protein [Lignipirellula cremea]QDU93047.1 hypothetical protein Pla8534_08220 [Lignipirellula cremea]